MQRIVFAILIAALCGCSTDSPRQGPPVVTELDARLISIARSAATAEGFSLTDAIYQVRRDGDGWIVQVDKAPGYSGVGEPAVVVDATFFVKLDANEQVREISSYIHRIKSTTQPRGGG